MAMHRFTHGGDLRHAAIQVRPRTTKRTRSHARAAVMSSRDYIYDQSVVLFVRYQSHGMWNDDVATVIGSARNALREALKE